MSIGVIIWLNTANLLINMKIPPDSFGFACVCTQWLRMSNPLNRKWKAHSLHFFIHRVRYHYRNFGPSSQSCVGWDPKSLDIKKVQKPLLCKNFPIWKVI